MPTYVSILHIPQTIWVWRATVEWYWQGKQKNLEKHLSQCHFVHHKSHTDWPGLEPGLTIWAMARPTVCYRQTFVPTFYRCIQDDICWDSLEIKYRVWRPAATPQLHKVLSTISFQIFERYPNLIRRTTAVYFWRNITADLHLHNYWLLHFLMTLMPLQ
jgi:hypothetical protein